MSLDKDYTKREMDSLLANIHQTLGRIETQTTKTNGRVSRLERNLLIVGCIVGTMLIMSGSRFVELIKTFI
jgi:hypothetical protein